MKQRVLPGVLKAEPTDLVRSRVILRAGSVTDSCGLARWSYVKGDGTSGSETLTLANVLTWTISNVPMRKIPLVRTQMHTLGNPTVQVDTAEADATDTLELFIRYVPAADTLPPSEQHPHAEYPGMPATHFRALYRLLGINDLSARVPYLERRLRDSTGTPKMMCPWRRPHEKMLLQAGVGTPNCMLATADPP
jgi:hypothetical protein